MRKTLTGFIFLLFSLAAYAQSDPEKYAATITSSDLRSQLTIIAGPGMEGRETATEGQRKAADYIAGQFKQFGLLPHQVPKITSRNTLYFTTRLYMPILL